MRGPTLEPFPPPHFISITDIETAPHAPGLYAWYMRAEFRPRDWLATVPGSQSTAPTRLQQRLSAMGAAANPAELQAVATGTFHTRWRGTLTAEAAGDRPDGNQIQSGTVEAAIQEEADRQLLTGLLQVTHPGFYTPLYIGVAKRSVRTRLRSHKTALLAPASHIVPELAEARILAERLRSLRIPPERLTILIGTVADKRTAQTDRVLSAAESLLNLWARPPLGRL